LSLFAERRLFELRMPSGKPDKGAQQLADMVPSRRPMSVCLVITDKLDKKAGDAAWVRAVDKLGVWVQVWPVATGGLARLAARAPPRRSKSRSNRPRHSSSSTASRAIFLPRSRAREVELVGRRRPHQRRPGAAIGGRQRPLRRIPAGRSGRRRRWAARSARAFGLKSEGVEPTLILWALVRELRGLWQARERDRLRSAARGSAWNLAATPSARALTRLKTLPLGSLLMQASRTDRIIKGMAAGDAWSALTGLTGALAGALQATPDSGRVAV